MKQQPDKLFREKLEQHSIPPPEAAWSRIQGNLSPKSVYGFWMKIAASLAILAIALLWLLPVQENKQVKIVENNLKRAVPSLPEKKSATEKPKKVELEKDKKLKSAKKDVKVINTPKKQALPTMNFPAQKNTITKVTTTEITIQPTQQQNIAQVPEPVQQNEALVESAQEEIENTTVVFAATEVNSKYLLKAKTSDATPPNQKTSSFRKFLDKATDLKNNQEAIGNLRQKKNEILALNFRNEKRERNN